MRVVLWLAEASGPLIHPPQKAQGRAMVEYRMRVVPWLAEASGSMIHPPQKALGRAIG